MPSVLGAGSVDLVLVDLPYGETHNPWDQPIDLSALWAEYRRVCKPTCALVFFASMRFGATLIHSNPAWFRYDVIWEKNKSTGFLNSKRQPLRSHEHLLLFYKRQPTYNPQKTAGHKPMNAATRHTGHGVAYRPATRVTCSDKGTTERYPKSVIRFPVVNNDSKSRLHTSQKPVDLCRWVIRTFTNPGDLVLDNCMGSGTTIVAAASEQRAFVGIEHQPAVYAQAEERVVHASF
jgi:DNA modification methylase